MRLEDSLAFPGVSWKKQEAAQDFGPFTAFVHICAKELLAAAYSGWIMSEGDKDYRAFFVFF